MARTKFARAGVVAAAAVTLIGFAASPAAADNLKISLPNGRGTMEHIDGGDKFRVCDTRADGHGVKGQLRGIDARNHIFVIMTINDGGDADCGVASHDIRLDTPHDMVLCWNGGGACVISRVFDE
ncbi:hypothetical protein OG352_26270 [Streptomyces sp. NBC_01485]|uniref:hypothetical protein n=1 Tax=Streptomyces sp. NBC_01485 TaxID=2903884 RepID=UPI002E2FCE6D|nr:hypothetical protein [Streptomyces sp. NBC_01485]